MAGILEDICETKRQHIEEMKVRRSYDSLRVSIEDMPLPTGFLSALKRNKGKAIIAEAKRASPSKGIIREDFDPLKIAQTYERAGATCLSILTDQPYFHGNDSYIAAVKEHVSLPILRKDFMLDPYQIFESRALGADCVLLIMAALDDDRACKLYETAIGLRLDVLVEVHNMSELERALKLNPMAIGVNNRNLNTMEVSLDTSRDLFPSIPEDCIKISESGISTREEVKSLSQLGYDGFLIGESLMRETNIAAALQGLTGEKETEKSENVVDAESELN